MAEKFVTHEELDILRQEFRGRIAEVVGLIAALRDKSGSRDELPPTPPKTSRKYQGEKIDIRARIDKSLFDLLDADAESTSGGNISRQLDIILWQYYNRPKLSWEDK